METDNALIHMYKEVEDVQHRWGAMLLYLSSYCLHLNPIEVMSGHLKSWKQRHTNLVFLQYPELVLQVAMRLYLRSEEHGGNLFHHCARGSE